METEGIHRDPHHHLNPPLALSPSPEKHLLAFSFPLLWKKRNKKGGVVKRRRRRVPKGLLF